MQYIDLVNKVLDESGKEQNPLSLVTWNSAEAGRRLYPRVKRLVREAWKMLQMKRNEWEFNSGEVVTTIFPKLRFTYGSKTAGVPAVSSVWIGRRSGIHLTILSIETDGDWTDGDGYGQIEFSTTSTSGLIEGEIFDEDGDDGEFEYAGTGSYRLLYGTNRVREPRWNTVKAKQSGDAYVPLVFVPWTQYLLGGPVLNSGRPVPTYFSQDYRGDLVFCGQQMQPFILSFMYDMAPQEFSDPEDEPEGLPTEYHEWIAWEALMNLARFDKDPDLFGYAESMATTYRQRAERNLMPIVEWETNRYNR